MAQNDVFNVGDIVRYNGKEGIVMDSELDSCGASETLYIFNPNDPDNYDEADSAHARKVPFNAATPRCQAAAALAKYINDLPWRK